MIDKPSCEWWDKAKEFIKQCSPEELRLVRLMSAKELEKRLSQWSTKLDQAESKEKAAKSKSIKKRIKAAL